MIKKEKYKEFSTDIEYLKLLEKDYLKLNTLM